MRLEEGKRYVRRDGKVTGELVQTGDGKWPLHDPIHDLSYFYDGCWIGCSVEGTNNLVKEYHET